MVGPEPVVVATAVVAVVIQGLSLENKLLEWISVSAAPLVSVSGNTC